jgi:hypothetical protein
LGYKAWLGKAIWPEIATLAPHDQEAANTFRSQLAQSPTYIVHLLNHLPLENELPALIYRKFLAGVPAAIRDCNFADAPAKKAPITVGVLASYYEGNLVEKETVKPACVLIWNGVLWDKMINGRSVGISAVAVRIPKGGLSCSVESNIA